MCEEKFWLYLWYGAFVFVFAISLSIGSCVQKSNEKVVQLVASGATATEASLAIYGSTEKIERVILAKGSK